MNFNFSDDYFQNEVRRGYEIPVLMKRIWAVSLHMLDRIEHVCMKHGLNYFADSGTLLGAVREHGMIPWDDDVDIFMTRKDFNVIRKVFAKEFPKDWQLIGTDDPDFPFEGFYRIVNSRNIVINESFLGRYYNCAFPIGIDIMVLDYYPRDPDMQDVILTILELAVRLALTFRNDPETDPNHELLGELEELTRTKIDRSGNIILQLQTLYEKVAALTLAEEADEYVLYGNTVNLISKGYTKDVRRAWSKDTFIPERVPFELPDASILIPKGYDRILRMYYGDKYMEPPKKIVQHSFSENFSKTVRDYCREVGDDTVLKILGIEP